MLQPLLGKALKMYCPSLRFSYAGIPAVNIASSVVLGTTFGGLHYFGYEKGGIPVVIAGSATGTLFGLIKERHGLTSCIAAHITHNLCIGLLDKHFPSFLESDLDRKLKNRS